MELYNIPKSIDDDIEKYEKLVNDFLNNKIDKLRLKMFRVPMGIYEQKINETYMMRVRVPAGNISPEKLKQVTLLSKKYTTADLHITTRQELQIHNLKLEQTVNLLKELKKIGLLSRGGGGNTVRNIIGSYDSGTDNSEAFDVLPYVKSLTDRMISESDSWSLPRKFKIAFSRNEKDTGNATVSDLGFIAKLNNNGEKGFKAFVAGGMGAKSEIGKVLFDYVPHTEVYNITKSVKLLFDKYGNRKNKHKARLRFLYSELGEIKFKQIFNEIYHNVKQKSYPELEIEYNSKIIINKNDFKFELPLYLGDISQNLTLELCDILINNNIKIIRFTMNQNIFLPEIPIKKVGFLKAEFEKKGILSNLFPIINSGTVCAGAGNCRLGICLSRNLFNSINDKINNSGISAKHIFDIKLKISGCPNSCGQHLIADIGLAGSAKKVNSRLIPFYNIFLGANIKENETKFAEKIGNIPAKNVPEFIVELLKFIQLNRKFNETFYEMYKSLGKQVFVYLLNKYKLNSTEIDEKYYFDFGADKPFSLAEKLEGECSAGIYDLIDWEFNNALNAITELKNHNENSDKQNLIRKIVESTASALLITKGLEPENSLESVKLFNEYFIDKYIEAEYKTVIEKYLNNEIIGFEDSEKFYNRVYKLYESMDNSLKFNEPENNSSTLKQKKKHFKDFRNVQCPMNFVKTKIALSPLKNGELLEVYLDDGEPIKNVPLSVKNEGHKILEKKQIDNYWSIIIERKGKAMIEKRRRSIIKAISYRITGTITTFIITFAITGKFELAFSIGIIDVIVKSFVFYFHERLWNKIKFGRDSKNIEYHI